jgi:RNA polymerase sigma-70 factor (ECF subfamily)
VTLSRDTTVELLDRAARGDASAVDRLLMGHRARLKRMVALRLDPRLAARTDPSDIVQEVLIAANARLKDYLHRRPIPFYPWLRQLACDELIRQKRRHLRAKARTVLREDHAVSPLSDESAQRLADRLAASASRPDWRLRRKESHERVKAALAQLSDDYREVLILKFLEELSTAEIAAVLKTTESAVRSRQFRALERLQELLSDDGSNDL